MGGEERWMSGTRRLSVLLPVELADLIETKVRSGEFTSESEVVSEGLRALQDQDATVDRWLHSEVVPAYDADREDSSRRIPAEQVWANLKAYMDAPPKIVR